MNKSHKTKNRNSIVPYLILGGILLAGIVFWVYVFYCKYISVNNLTEAGQLGDSFGFFNSVALLIITLTLLYQIKEYQENRNSILENIQLQRDLKNAEIENAYYTKMYESLLKEYDRYNEVYLKYLTMFEEIKNGKTYQIAISSLVNMVNQLFDTFFKEIQVRYNSLLGETFSPDNIEIDYSKQNYDLVFTNIRQNLSKLIKSINDLYLLKIDHIQKSVEMIQKE